MPRPAPLPRRPLRSACLAASAVLWLVASSSPAWSQQSEGPSGYSTAAPSERAPIVSFNRAEQDPQRPTQSDLRIIPREVQQPSQAQRAFDSRELPAPPFRQQSTPRVQTTTPQTLAPQSGRFVRQATHEGAVDAAPVPPERAAPQLQERRPSSTPVRAPKTVTPKLVIPKEVRELQTQAQGPTGAAPRLPAPSLPRGDYRQQADGGRGFEVFEPSTTESLTTAAAGLGIVIVLFLLCSLMFRKNRPSANSKLPAEAVSLLGKLPIAPKVTAQLIQVGNKLVLVSVSPERVETITEVTDPVEVGRLVGLCVSRRGGSTTTDFEDVLRQLSREPATGFLDPGSLPAATAGSTRA